MAKTQTLIDQETLIYLDKQREDDNIIVRNIEAEHESIGFIFEHSERFNNWKTDELYVERARLAEAAFLEKIHAQEQESMKKRQFEEDVSQKLIEDDQNTFSFIVNEMKSLKVQCDLNNVAAEKIKRGKNIMKERRLAAQAQLARVKALQERERKSLEGTHARKLKMTELARNVKLREVEDAEIRVVLRGLEFNEKTAADETARAEALIQKERKNHHARVLNQLMRNQKEIEQMREIHLLQQRYISRYIDYELEIIDENEALLSEHTTKEQALEDHHKIQAEVEENVMNLKLVALQRNQNERVVNHLASRAKERQHRDAKLLAFKDAREARRREKAFWFRELEYLHAELKRSNLPTEGPAYFSKREELLPGIPKDLEVEIDDALLFDDDDDVSDESSSFDEINVEAARAREVALFETLKKSQKDAVKKLRNEQHRIREARRVEHQKNLRAIRAAQETEIKNLQRQQKLEMKSFEDTQKSSDKADEDNAASNERLYGMLPKFVADVMKTGASVEPKHFKSLAFLTADIVSFTNLSSKSSAKQVVALLNRLYSQMDDVIDSFEDIYKLETIGDAYNIVSGLNTQETLSETSHVISIIECAQRFMDIVRSLDMTDQITDHIQIRVGIHVGPAVGGVANMAMPKYSLFGDTVTITGQMEQTSRPMEIHVSGPACDLVKDVFEFEVSESVPVLDMKQRMPAWWLLHKKSRASFVAFGGNAAQ